MTSPQQQQQQGQPMPEQRQGAAESLASAPAHEALPAAPAVKVIGRIAGRTGDAEDSGSKILVHTGWSDKTHELSPRGLKVLRSIGIEIVDNPAEYQI